MVEEAPEGTPVFNQPAGHLEANETLADAVIREVREETCRLFVPKGLIGIYQWVSPKGATYVRFCFHGEVGEALEYCRLDPDIRATHWLDESQLKNGYPSIPLLWMFFLEIQPRLWEVLGPVHVN